MSGIMASRRRFDTSLTIGNLSSSSSLQTIALVQQHTLSVQNLNSEISLQNPTLIQNHSLSVSNLNSGSSLQSPSLTQQHTLSVNNLNSGSSLQNVVLTTSNLIVQNLFSQTTLEALRSTQSYTINSIGSDVNPITLSTGDGYETELGAIRRLDNEIIVSVGEVSVCVFTNDWLNTPIGSNLFIRLKVTVKFDESAGLGFRFGFVDRNSGDGVAIYVSSGTFQRQNVTSFTSFANASPSVTSQTYDVGHTFQCYIYEGVVYFYDDFGTIFQFSASGSLRPYFYLSEGAFGDIEIFYDTQPLIT